MEVSVRFSSLCLLCVRCTSVGTSRGTKGGRALMPALSPQEEGVAADRWPPHRSCSSSSSSSQSGRTASVSRGVQTVVLDK